MLNSQNDYNEGAEYSRSYVEIVEKAIEPGNHAEFVGVEEKILQADEYVSVVETAIVDEEIAITAPAEQPENTEELEAEQAAPAPAEEIADEPVEEIAEISAEEIADEPVEEIAEVSAEEIADEPVEEIAEISAEEIADEPVEEIAEISAEDIPVSQQIEESPLDEIPADIEEEVALAYDGPEMPVEEEYETVVRYTYGFKAKLMRANDDVKNFYTDIKNELLSYKKVRERASFKRENYRFGRTIVARLAFKGKALCLYLALNAEEFEGTKYRLKAVNPNWSIYTDTPSYYKISNPRRLKHASYLIAETMARVGADPCNHVAVDYYMENNYSLDEMVEQGLVKRREVRVNKSNPNPFFNFKSAKAADSEATVSDAAASPEQAEAVITEAAGVETADNA